jgi:hypothetical protein
LKETLTKITIHIRKAPWIAVFPWGGGSFGEFYGEKDTAIRVRLTF